MENKVLFDGIILNDVKLSDFNSVLLRVQNKQQYTTKEGTQKISSCIMIVTLKGLPAQAIAKRFKRGDSIRVQGALQLKKTDKMDQEGREIWETWIRALKVDALAEQQNLAPVPEKLQSSPATIKQNKQFTATVPKNYPQQPFYAKASAGTQQKPLAFDDIANEEDPFGDRLPF